MSLLTEQEITEIVREAARGSATRLDGSTSQRIARAIEAKARANLLEEIKAQGPVKAVAVMVFGAVCSTYKIPVEDYYRLPEGD